MKRKVMLGTVILGIIVLVLLVTVRRSFLKKTIYREIICTAYDENGELEFENTKEFSGKGQLLRDETVYTNGTEFILTYEYDKMGRETSCTETDGWSYLDETKCEYATGGSYSWLRTVKNEENDVIFEDEGEGRCDSDGKPIALETESGYKREWSYDEKGNCVVDTFCLAGSTEEIRINRVFDGNKCIVEEMTDSETERNVCREFDENGNVKREVKTVEGTEWKNGNSYGYKNITVLFYTYNENGALIRIDRYDDDGEKLGWIDVVCDNATKVNPRDYTPYYFAF